MQASTVVAVALCALAACASSAQVRSINGFGLHVCIRSACRFAQVPPPLLREIQTDSGALLARQAQNLTDTNILNFALNLEYLEVHWLAHPFEPRPIADDQCCHPCDLIMQQACTWKPLHICPMSTISCTHRPPSTHAPSLASRCQPASRALSGHASVAAIAVTSLHILPSSPRCTLAIRVHRWLQRQRAHTHGMQEGQPHRQHPGELRSSGLAAPC